MTGGLKAIEERLGNGLGDTNGLSWSINYLGVVAQQEFVVSRQERKVLRELAKIVRELSESPIQQEKKERWKRHHALEVTQPLVFCDPEGAWYEIIRAEDLVCRTSLARIWEFRLKKEIFWAERIRDDRVVEATFPVHYLYTKSSRGLEPRTIGGQAGSAYRWESPLQDGYEAMAQLRPSHVQVDRPRTRQLEELAHQVFDGLLDVKLEGVWWWSLGMTTDLIYLRGFENILFDFHDRPEDIHRLMAFLRDENLAMLDDLERKGLLTLNNGGDFHGTGGYGWTDELPATGSDAAHVRVADLWGFCESQETIGVSPEMFAEFVFPYQLEILERFGLNIYGCCEPLDARWEIIRRIPRLRKVTVSPWSNDAVMAEQLGPDYVFCKKVNPARVATTSLDEDGIRKELRSVFESTQRHGCPTEVLLRDVMTISDNPTHVVRWVECAREEAERVRACP